MYVSIVCCIYHKPRAVGESSSEDDSDDSSSSDDPASDKEHKDDVRARTSGGGSNRRKHKHHLHGPDEGCGKDRAAPPLKSSPNAYEKLPKGSGIQDIKK